MHEFYVGALIFIPTGLSVIFLAWVFWNLSKQSRRRRRKRPSAAEPSHKI